MIDVDKTKGLTLTAQCRDYLYWDKILIKASMFLPDQTLVGSLAAEVWTCDF